MSRAKLRGQQKLMKTSSNVTGKYNKNEFDIYTVQLRRNMAWFIKH